MPRVTHNQGPDGHDLPGDGRQSRADDDRTTADEPAGRPTESAPEAPAAGTAAHSADDSVTARLTRIEALLTDAARAAPAHGGAPAPAPGGPARGLAEAEQRLLPAWRRITRGETRWASSAAVLAAVALQLALPARFAIHPQWLTPGIELALLFALIAANPHRIERGSRAYRWTGLGLTALLSATNAIAAVRLVQGLIRGTEGGQAGPLLAIGGSIWLTNVIAFALWYWEYDRGGPIARARADRRTPDFLFVQMQVPEVAPAHWEPTFLDYFYLSFTNATAFSPTDVMPLARSAKMLMLLQAAVSLLTVVLVVARAVNILK